MASNNSLEDLNNISHTINIKLNKIWEYEAKIKYMETDIGRAENETEQFKKEIENIKKENDLKELQIEQLTKSNKFQMDTLKICEKSLDCHKAEKIRCQELLETYKLKYNKLIQETADEVQKKRNRLEQNSKLYKELKLEQLNLKKIKIITLQLETEIQKKNEIIRQYNNIEKQRFDKTIVEFARHCLEAKKLHETFLLLKQAEIEEKQWMRKYLELQDEAKKNKANKSIKNINKIGLGCQQVEFHKIDIEPFNPMLLSANPPPQKPSYLSKQFKFQHPTKTTNSNTTPISKETRSLQPKAIAASADPPNLNQEKVFSADKSKIQILDIKKFKPNDSICGIKKFEPAIQDKSPKSMQTKKTTLINKNLPTSLSQKSDENYKCGNLFSNMSQELNQLNLDRIDKEINKSTIIDKNKENNDEKENFETIKLKPVLKSSFSQPKKEFISSAPQQQFQLKPSIPQSQIESKSSVPQQQLELKTQILQKESNFKSPIAQTLFSFSSSQKRNHNENENNNNGQTSKYFNEAHDNTNKDASAKIRKLERSENAEKNIIDENKPTTSVIKEKEANDENKNLKEMATNEPQLMQQQFEPSYRSLNPFNYENFNSSFNPITSLNEYDQGIELNNELCSSNDFNYGEDLYNVSNNLNFTSSILDDNLNPSQCDAIFPFGQASKGFFKFD